MRVRANITIKSGGTYYPPGSIVPGLSEDDIEALKGHITVEDGDDVEVSAGESEGGDDDTSEGDASEGGEGGGEGSEGGESRVEAIKAAIDLLDPEKDFVKTGERAGKPKIDALSEVLGFKPDPVEIEAALAIVDAGA